MTLGPKRKPSDWSMIFRDHKRTLDDVWINFMRSMFDGWVVESNAPQSTRVAGGAASTETRTTFVPGSCAYHYRSIARLGETNTQQRKEHLPWERTELRVDGSLMCLSLRDRVQYAALSRAVTNSGVCDGRCYCKALSCREPG